jgi:hypothetical protein
MSVEKTWLAIAPVQFAANGKTSGEVQLTSSAGIRVGMKVRVQSSSLPESRELKVKRVVGNSVWLGPAEAGIERRTDMSAYTVADGAFLYADEQPKAHVPGDDQTQASWEHEPVNARRVVSVDDRGRLVGEDNPVPVKEGADWDVADITRDGEDDIVEVAYSKGGQTVETLALEYNGEKSVIKVTKT